MKVVFCPAGMVFGVVSPLIANPVPLTLAEEITMLVLPLFVSVKVCGEVVPTATPPKAKLPGLAINVAFAATPLPESDRVCGDPGALSVKMMLPETPPLVVGANCTVKERLWPPVSVAGNERPFIAKPAPESVARFTTTFTFPLFVSFTVCVLL